MYDRGPRAIARHREVFYGKLWSRGNESISMRLRAMSRPRRASQVAKLLLVIFGYVMFFKMSDAV